MFILPVIDADAVPPVPPEIFLEIPAQAEIQMQFDIFNFETGEILRCPGDAPTLHTPLAAWGHLTM